jgi:hypothetical protein
VTEPWRARGMPHATRSRMPATSTTRALVAAALGAVVATLVVSACHERRERTHAPVEVEQAAPPAAPAPSTTAPPRETAPPTTESPPTPPPAPAPAPATSAPAEQPTPPVDSLTGNIPTLGANNMEPSTSAASGGTLMAPPASAIGTAGQTMTTGAPLMPPIEATKAPPSNEGSVTGETAPPTSAPATPPPQPPVVAIVPVIVPVPVAGATSPDTPVGATPSPLGAAPGATSVVPPGAAATPTWNRVPPPASPMPSPSFQSSPFQGSTVTPSPMLGPGPIFPW